MLSRFLVLTMLAAACTNDGAPDGDSGAVEIKEIPLGTNANIDILFVVDNSPSMAPYRGHLAAQAGPLIRAIEGTQFHPNVHVGVVSGDPAEAGHLHGGRFLVDETHWNWQPHRNYTGTLPDNFASLFDVAATGPTGQSLVGNAANALSSTTNPGFIRDDAYLAVVFLTATDEPNESNALAIDIIKNSKSDPAKVTVSAATLNSPPHMQAVLDQFPSRTATVALDATDLTPLVALLQYQLKTTLGAACVEAKIAQPMEASASLVNPATGDEASFPACAGTTTDHCWAFVADPAACPSGDHLRIDLPYTPFSATAIFNIATVPDQAD